MVSVRRVPALDEVEHELYLAVAALQQGACHLGCLKNKYFLNKT
jgi:hypothetical protein